MPPAPQSITTTISRPSAAPAEKWTAYVANPLRLVLNSPEADLTGILELRAELHPQRLLMGQPPLAVASVANPSGYAATLNFTAAQLNQDLGGTPRRTYWLLLRAVKADGTPDVYQLGTLDLLAHPASDTTPPPPDPAIVFATVAALSTAVGGEAAAREAGDAALGTRVSGLEADASSLPPAITSTADVWLRSESLTYAEGERIPAWPNAADPLKPLAQADGTKQPIRIAAGAYQTRAVAFGGISFLSASVTRTYPRTIYTVMRVRKPTPDVAAPWSTVTSGYPVLNRSSGVFGAAFYMTGDGGSYVEMPRTIRPDESWLIMRAVINGANSSLQINRDAAAYATGTIVTSTSTSLVLGAQGTALLSNLDLMEHIEFPGLLSDADDAAIHEWLNANYVQHSLLVADGTSLTFGPTNGDWPTLINPMLPGNWLVNNFAVAGQTLAQMAADAPTQIDARVNLLARNRIMFAEAPTNTIYSITNGTDTGTPDSVYEEYMVFCADRMATGKFDFLIQNTMMHRTTVGTPAGNNAFVDAVNALIRAGAAAAGYGLADWIADPRLQDPSNTEWFSDGTHPTEKGNQEVIAPMIAAVITRWLSNHNRRALAEDNIPAVLPTLSVTGDLRVGSRTVEVVDNPKRIYMGNDIASGTPGTAGNLKFQLAEAATLEWGFGLSANLMEFQAPVAGGAFAFFAGGFELFRLSGAVVSFAPQIQLNGTLWKAGANFAYADAATAQRHRIALFATTPTYANDAAAAADTGLPSGSPYLITGSTALHLKP